MSRRDRWLLRASAVWTFLIWSVFVRNLVGDDEHSTGFKVVHLTLAVVSVGLAALVWKVSTRAPDRVERQPAPTDRI